MPRVSATLIYELATGVITGTYLGKVGQDGKIPRVTGMEAQTGEGIVLLSPDQVEAIANAGVVVLALDCYVDTTQDPHTVVPRTPAEIRVSKNTVLGNGEDSCTILVFSENERIPARLRASGRDHGRVSCPAGGVTLTFTHEGAVTIDIEDRKYRADERNIYVEEVSDGA